ncbi:DNA polymerase [Mycoplasma phage P1]|uniref:DNA-directed DNA polymerase n=1 Tax=Mycoplasma phage P1 TaxID=2905920 RepID=Q9FZR8_9CAUD|nr:DNA polymerase [Mycoplasma phage P1]AAG01276.1 P82 [Mycoplasma phage P1]
MGKMNKKMIKPTLVLAADFETRTINQKSEDVQAIAQAFGLSPVLLKYKDKKEYLQEKTLFYANYGNDIMEEFFQSIYSYLKEYKTNQVIIYFFNSKNFDSFFIRKYLIQNKFEFKLDIQEHSNKSFKTIHTKAGILEIAVKKDRYYLYFRDIYPHLPGMSIDKLGAMLNKPKGDFTNYDLDLSLEQSNNSLLFQEFRDYTIRDTEIVRDSIFRLETKGDYDFSKGLTSATIAYKDFREKYDFISDKFTTKDLSHWEFAKQSYFGGYTNVFPGKALKIYNNVKILDINSAYPYVMTLPVVIGSPFETIPIDSCKNMHCTNQKHFCYTSLYLIKITNGRLKKEFPPIIRRPLKRYNLKYNMSNYNSPFISDISSDFEILVWEEELEHFKAFYEDFEYEVLTIRYYRLETLFKGHILELYNQRLNFKAMLKETNEENEERYIYAMVSELLTKIKLNSLYGKFGQNAYNSFKVYLDFEVDKSSSLLFNVKKQAFTLNHEEMEDSIEYDIESQNQKVLDKFVYTVYQQKPFLAIDKNNNIVVNKNMKYKNIAIASYITMRVRSLMFEAIYQLKDKFIYGDTDSIMFEDCEDLKFKLNIDANELGAFKVEMEKASIIVVKPKNYFIFKNGTIVKKAQSGYKQIKEYDKYKNNMDLLLHDLKEGLIKAEALTKTTHKDGSVSLEWVEKEVYNPLNQKEIYE